MKTTTIKIGLICSLALMSCNGKTSESLSSRSDYKEESTSKYIDRMNNTTYSVFAQNTNTEYRSFRIRNINR